VGRERGNFKSQCSGETAVQHDYFRSLPLAKMQRAVFDRSIVDGYRTSKTEGIAVTALGRKLFAGTGDGSIVLYDCKPDTVGSTSTSSLFNRCGICLMIYNVFIARIYVFGRGQH